MGTTGKNAQANSSRNAMILLAKLVGDVRTRFIYGTPLPRGRGSVTVGSVRGLYEIRAGGPRFGLELSKGRR
jgi:hypothetical protein